MNKIDENVQIPIEDINFLVPDEKTNAIFYNARLNKFRNNLGTLIIKIFLICFAIALLQLIAYFSQGSSLSASSVIIIVGLFFIIFSVIVSLAMYLQFKASFASTTITYVNANVYYLHYGSKDKDLMKVNSSEATGSIVLFSCDQGICTTGIKADNLKEFINLKVGDPIYIIKSERFGEPYYRFLVC